MKTIDPNQVFMYHPPREDQIGRYERIRKEGKSLANVLLQFCPVSDDRDVALQKLRECIMWANASIACNED